jgi:light-regulated signal transduction histidine kinase (bacteriophytochrome)
LVQIGQRWLLFTPQNVDNRLIISITDVSRQQVQLAELQRQHRDLEVRADKLQRSNEDLEQFAYVASHDLQEPLRKIMSFGERLTKRYATQLEGDGQMFIERMGEAAKRMEQLIDDLLAYSRATRRDQSAEPTNLQDCLNDALADLEVAIERSGATVSLPTTTLPTVHAVPSQMRQVLLNLLGNALNFVRPGVPPLIQIEHFERSGSELSEWAAAPHLQYCVVKISDNGIGFAPDNAERIFKVFQRLHGRSEYKGSGIGLSICKKIIENYGGFIVADSQPGEGATFTFGLPL